LVFAQHDTKEGWSQHGWVVEQMEKLLNEATKMLTEAAEDILVFTSFPKSDGM
jgi:hypothetical protein